MPELPEVETIVRGLSNKVLSRTFINVWTDSEKIVKKPKSFKQFKKQITGKRVKKVKRRGKNILFELSKGKTLLVHQKMTGHFLIGKWIRKNNKWMPKQKGALEEKVNSYIRIMFHLDNNLMLALCDLRKFAKIELWETKELEESDYLKNLGPEPLAKDFTFKLFKKRLKNKKGKIKSVLMNQAIIVGIGNVYSDEILWKARVHPSIPTNLLSEKELREIYQAIKQILKKAAALGGDSFSDFRDIEGNKGFFNEKREVYHKKICSRCGTRIEKKKINARTAHFCPSCQKFKIPEKLVK